MVGSWNVEISDKMPQKVASAFAGVDLIGAEYTFIAYLGSQVVNGTNHAVLAEQLLTTGKDTKNVVVMIFNEKGMDCTLVNIERVVEGGVTLGGTYVNVETNLDEEDLDVFNRALEGYVGAKITPFALLGSQVTVGTNYMYAALFENMSLNGKGKVVLVTVNDVTHTVQIVDLLNDRSQALGYAFTW